MVNAFIVAALATAVSGAAVTRETRAIAANPVGDSPYPAPKVDENDFIGGEPVKAADYPYIVAGLRSGGGRAQTQSCSGSAIGPRKILTAAHCADASGTKTWVHGSDDLNKGTYKKIEVVSYKKHPKYKNFDQGYDVAVVTTKTDIPVPAGGYAKFATSADKGISAPGKIGFGLGYGKKEVDDSTKNVELHKGSDIPVVDSKTCDESGQGLKVKPATMICAGFETGRPVTVLQGDSGGPLVVDGKIIGVASWSKSTWDWYSIYGRLDNDMGDWVAQELKK